MDEMGICFSGVYYGANQINILRPILKRNKLLIWTRKGGLVNIRPDTPRNRELMKRDNGQTEAETVRENGRG